MAYGTRDKAKAEAKAKELRERYPHNRYEVQGYDFGNQYGKNATPLSWGVMSFVEYCAKMPYRCNGFIWAF